MLVQALNNWGLVLQELSTMRSPAERLLLVQQSVAKFRRAIRLRPEFDRACYNLGTVYYAHACSLQNEFHNPAADQVCLFKTVYLGWGALLCLVQPCLFVPCNWFYL